MAFVVSLLTPFDGRGRVDLARLRAHVLWLSALGVDGFVCCGAAGEFFYLSDREREAVQRTVLDAARDKLVVPCTWDPSPTTTAYLTQAALDQGAHAALLPPPLFYEFDSDTVRQWYTALGERGKIWAWHTPPSITTGVDAALYGELLERGVLSGMMDASGDLWRVRRLAAIHPGTVWVGEDRLMPAARQETQLAGVVSDLANVWPSFCLRLWQGEADLDVALLERAIRLRHAGGLRALKSLLRMGCRSPLVEPPDEALNGLPAPELP